jgi:acetylornithine deacetylase/succinyl-diaminopimelate desuccinylase-like protein
MPWGEPGYSFAERTGSRPTLEINGIYGGYAGEGFKTVIPAQAIAKISCRLVTNQQPKKVLEQVTNYIHAIAPPTVRIEIHPHSKGDPIRIPIDNPLVKALVRAYEMHWSTPVAYKRTGGTIPIVAMFQNELGLAGVPYGFGLADSGIHGPNENYHVDLFYKGVDTTIRFLQEIASGG